MSRIFVLVGHPRRESYCAALADAYAEAARAAGHEVMLRHLADVDVTLAAPDYAKVDPAPPAWVLREQADIAWAEHWVLAAPMWWGGLPAAMKAYLDQVLLPGFAFRYRAKGQGWDKLLQGRSARLLLTADTPPFVLHWLWGFPLERQLRRQVFGFCGISAKTTLFAPIKPSDGDRRAGWIKQVAALGHRGD